MNLISEKRWFASDTYKFYYEFLLGNSILIEEDEFIDAARNFRCRIDKTRFSRFLFTNKMLVDTLNFLEFENTTGGLYRIFNEYSPSLHVFYDKIDRQYYIREGYQENPIVGVSWVGASLLAFLFGGRLPSEAEWVYAATSGNPENIYPWGTNDPQVSYANYAEHVGATTPIGQYPPNMLGIYDAAGNAEEWCSDWYTPDTAYLNNRKFQKNLKFTEKVVKGGGWNKEEELLQCYTRRGKFHRIGTHSIGFRIIWDL